MSGAPGCIRSVRAAALRSWATALLVLAARPTTAEPWSAAVRMLSYPNGPRVLLAPDSLAGAAHVGLWFDAGSRNDPRGQAGLAFVVARASLRVPDETLRSLEAAGASFDLTVTSDMTAASVTVPAEQLRPALEAELSVLGSPAIDETRLREAIEGVRAERARRLAQSPLVPGIERVCASVFADHGYGRPASGLDSDLDAITVAAARQDLASRFAPSHALVTVTGRFDPRDALEALGARFGTHSAAPAAPAAAAVSFGNVVPHASAGATRLPVGVVLAGWRLVPDRDADSAALEVLARLLAAGVNARLERALITDAGPFLQIQGSFERRADACLLVIAAAVRGVTDTAKVEQQLTTEVERWGREALSATELEPAQHVVEADLLVRAQTAGGRAESLAAAQLIDQDWHAWEQRVARVHALTPADVQHAAARSLVPARRAIVWAAPASEAEGSEP